MWFQFKNLDIQAGVASDFDLLVQVDIRGNTNTDPVLFGSKFFLSDDGPLSANDDLLVSLSLIIKCISYTALLRALYE